MRDCGHEDCEEAFKNRDDKFEQFFSKLKCEFGAECKEPVHVILWRARKAYYLCVLHAHQVLTLDFLNIFKESMKDDLTDSILKNAKQPTGEHPKGS